MPRRPAKDRARQSNSQAQSTTNSSFQSNVSDASDISAWSESCGESNKGSLKRLRRMGTPVVDIEVGNWCDSESDGIDFPESDNEGHIHEEGYGEESVEIGDVTAFDIELQTAFGGNLAAHARARRRRWVRDLVDIALQFPTSMSEDNIRMGISDAFVHIWEDSEGSSAIDQDSIIGDWVTPDGELVQSGGAGTGNRYVMSARLADARLDAVWRAIKRKAFLQVRVSLSLMAGDYLSSPSASPDNKIQQYCTIRHCIRMLYPFEPREEQLEILWHMVFSTKDLVWIAKTSAGKSLAFQSYASLVDKTVIIILPLNQIGYEQEVKIQAMGGRPLLFTSGVKASLTKQQTQDLENGQYSHVLISPEMAQQRWFRQLQIRPGMRERLGMLVVDEMHLVWQWGAEGGGFRPEYAQLESLRMTMRTRVRFFGCSATLDPDTLKHSIQHAGFRNPTIVRHSIDRPEISMRACAIPQGCKTDYSGIWYLIDGLMSPDGVRNPQPLDKTVVFIDSRAGCHAAASNLRAHIQKKWPGRFSDRELYQLIRTYHGRTAKRTQANLMREFGRPDSKVRILFATEALGLGVDLPDIKRIVQFGIPMNGNLRVIMQRAGRAVRDSKLYGKGSFTFLYESYGELDRQEKPENQPTQTRAPARMQEIAVDSDDDQEQVPEPYGRAQKPPKPKKKKKTDQDKCDDMEWNMHQFINAIRNGVCRRMVIMRFFKDPTSPTASPCCDYCHPSIRLDSDAVKAATILPSMERAVVNRPYEKRLLERLIAWEATACRDAFRWRMFPAMPFMLVPKKILEVLAREWGIEDALDNSQANIQTVMMKAGFAIKSSVVEQISERIRVFRKVCRDEDARQTAQCIADETARAEAALQRQHERKANALAEKVARQATKAANEAEREAGLMRSSERVRIRTFSPGGDLLDTGRPVTPEQQSELDLQDSPSNRLGTKSAGQASPSGTTHVGKGPRTPLREIDKNVRNSSGKKQSSGRAVFETTPPAAPSYIEGLRGRKRKAGYVSPRFR